MCEIVVLRTLNHRENLLNVEVLYVEYRYLIAFKIQGVLDRYIYNLGMSNI